MIGNYCIRRDSMHDLGLDASSKKTEYSEAENKPKQELFCCHIDKISCDWDELADFACEFETKELDALVALLSSRDELIMTKTTKFEPNPSRDTNRPMYNRCAMTSLLRASWESVVQKEAGHAFGDSNICSLFNDEAESSIDSYRNSILARSFYLRTAEEVSNSSATIQLAKRTLNQIFGESSIIVQRERRLGQMDAMLKRVKMFPESDSAFFNL